MKIPGPMPGCPRLTLGRAVCPSAGAEQRLPSPIYIFRCSVFRIPFHIRRIAFPVLLLAVTLQSRAAEVDLSKLPPPANVQVDFDRDIKPIFEARCWRCHG